MMQPKCRYFSNNDQTGNTGEQKDNAAECQYKERENDVKMYTMCHVALFLSSLYE